METKSQSWTLLLSNNLINGTIPSSVCNCSFSVLDLSNNFLAGEIPTCQGNSLFTQLVVLNLANNNLSGKIPNSMGYLQFLGTLHLNHNSLSGEIPLAMRNCTFLILIDLGENRLSGHIPAWIGGLSSLMILRLHSNMFYGGIPPQLMRLTSLQILDLAHNDLSGSIPQSISNLSAMISKHEPFIFDLESRYTVSWTTTCKHDYLFFSRRESLLLDVKGRVLQYEKLLSLVVGAIDLSDNKFGGEIPAGMTELVQLQSLNLSNNQFTGAIPEKIGNRNSLESLDLSKNKLSGTIRSSVLTSLSYLNLSDNNLSGRIPSGNQLQTLDDPSIYAGSDNNLFGSPLPKKRRWKNRYRARVPADGNGGTDDDAFEMLWFYLGAVLGWPAGFWVVFGILIVKENWRIAYFRCADQVYDKFYVAAALMFIRLRRKMS